MSSKRHVEINVVSHIEPDQRQFVVIIYSFFFSQMLVGIGYVFIVSFVLHFSFDCLDFQVNDCAKETKERREQKQKVEIC